IKPKNLEENSKFLDLMMFRTISDIHLLNRKELFSLVLAIHFQFQEKTREEKLMITKELKKLVIYIFRTIIIKGKIEDENALRTIRINILKMVNLGQILLFGQEKYPINLIIEEFCQGADSFYQSLVERQSKKDKGLEIEKFIFLTYYQKKIKESKLIINLFDYDIRQLVSQNFEIKEIGDNEKRKIYKELGDNCLMNCLEEEHDWTEIEDINDLIEKRKKYLIEDFKRLQIFEVD
ncbi:19191_t:CDS:2, partial [Funneliformis geosporum]